MNPLKALDLGYTIVFPNNRSKDLWVEKYLKTHKSSVLQGYSAMTFYELMSLFFQQSPNFYSRKVLTEGEAFFYHAYHLRDFYSKEVGALDVEKTIKAIDLMAHWLIDNKTLEHFSLLPKEKMFKDYYLFYQKKDSVLTTLPEAIKESLEISNIKLPTETLYFWAIDDLTPLQEKFISYLQLQHVVIFQQDEECELSVDKLSYDKSDDEINSAFSWLHSQPSDKACAVVIPSLASDFSKVHSQAQNFFDSANQALPLQSVSDEFVISHGFVAVDYPLISQTLSWLQSQSQTCCFVDPQFVIKSQDTACQKPLSLWVQWLFLTLDKAQWCQTFELSSSEYQVREFFLSFIDEVASISHWIGNVDYQFFIETLRKCLSKMIFQPESPRKKVKLILGLLEAAALPLDKVYLIQTSEQKLLSQVQAHPYFNKELTRNAQMPHSSWEREVSYLTKMIVRLLRDKQGVISYSLTESYLARRHTPCLLIEKMTNNADYQKQVVVQKPTLELTQFYPSTQVRWPDKRWTLSHVNSYYKCPFLGFVKKMRIPGIEIEQSVPLSPKEQGIFFHEYLQNRIENKPLSLVTDTLNFLPQVLKQCEIDKAERVYQDCQKSLDLQSFKSEYSWTMKYQSLQFVGRYDLYCPETGAIFDFKSKNFNFSSWFSQEPSDIQGALYSLSSQAQTLGVIKPDAKGAKVRHEKVHPFQQSWTALLSQVTESIEKEQCVANPRYESECRSCHYKQGCKYEFSR